MPDGIEGEIIYNDDFNIMQFCDNTNWVSMVGGSASGGGGGSLADGDKGDVTVSGAGATWTVDAGAISYAKLQNVTATSRLLGRASAGAGIVEEITIGSGLTLTGTTLSAAGGGSSSGTAGYIQFAGVTTGSFASSPTTTGQQFVWDDSNHRLGVNTATPTQALDVEGTVTPNSLLMKKVAGADEPIGGTGGGGGGGGNAALVVSTVTTSSSSPVTCNSTHDGAIALTSFYIGCVCKNGTGWVMMSDGSSDCPWAQDNAPNTFSFTDLTSQLLGASISSNTLTISGIGPGTVPVSVSGSGNNPQISINGGGWSASGNISNGQTLQVRQTSSSAASTLTAATVTLGSVNSTWNVTTQADACGGSPTAGETICADGSIYIGSISATKIFIQRCDIGMSWNGSTCIGSRTSKTWAGGSAYDIPTITNCSTPAGCGDNALANIAAILALSSTAHGYPFNAVQTCEDLVENGRSDWYLPSPAELVLINTSKNATKIVGNLDTMAGYWSSSEASASQALSMNVYSGSTAASTSKTGSPYVRCARR